MCNRKIGLEFEICGQEWKQGEQIIEKVTRKKWELHDDGSIPYVRLKRECHCDKSRVCHYCSGKEDTCQCCLCSVKCPNCNYSTSIKDIVYFRTHGHYQGKQNPCWYCHKEIPQEVVDKVSSSCKKTGYCSFQYRSDTARCNCKQEVSGFELVSPPFSGEREFNTVKRIFTQLKKNAKENGVKFRSLRPRSETGTGFHVHVDASDLFQYKNRVICKEKAAKTMAICLYIQERWEILSKNNSSVLTKSRKNWVYAEPYPLRYQQGKTLEEIYSYFRGDYERYRTVNLESLDKHGTLEFRSGYMPLRAADAIKWAKFCRDLVDSVAKSNLEFKGKQVKEAMAMIDELLAPAKVPEMQTA